MKAAGHPLAGSNDSFLQAVRFSCFGYPEAPRSRPRAASVRRCLPHSDGSVPRPRARLSPRPRATALRPGQGGRSTIMRWLLGRSLAAHRSARRQNPGLHAPAFHHRIETENCRGQRRSVHPNTSQPPQTDAYGGQRRPMRQHLQGVTRSHACSPGLHFPNPNA